jgi:hypothetical protein
LNRQLVVGRDGHSAEDQNGDGEQPPSRALHARLDSKNSASARQRSVNTNCVLPAATDTPTVTPTAALAPVPVLSPGDQFGRTWLVLLFGVFLYVAFRRLRAGNRDAGPR